MIRMIRMTFRFFNPRWILPFILRVLRLIFTYIYVAIKSHYYLIKILYLYYEEEEENYPQKTENNPQLWQLKESILVSL